MARFTGLSGELEGIVSAGGGADEYVLVEGGRWRLRARASGDVRTGEPVRVLVRPAATGFVADHSDAAGTEIAMGEVAGTVIDVAYRGRGYDHVVSCGNGTLAAVFSTRAHARGAQAKVSLDPSGCIAFPLNDTDAFSYDTDLTTVTAGEEPAAIKQGATP